MKGKDFFSEPNLHFYGHVPAVNLSGGVYTPGDSAIYVTFVGMVSEN